MEKEQVVKSAEEKSTPNKPIERFTFNVGDKVVVTTTIKDEDRVRPQKFEGLVIAKKGKGIARTFTVRRISTGEIGVERIFPINSPLVESVVVVQPSDVRRSKLYYLRDRKGKAASQVKTKK